MKPPAVRLETLKAPAASVVTFRPAFDPSRMATVTPASAAPLDVTVPLKVNRLADGDDGELVELLHASAADESTTARTPRAMVRIICPFTRTRCASGLKPTRTGRRASPSENRSYRLS